MKDSYVANAPIQLGANLWFSMSRVAWCSSCLGCEDDVSGLKMISGQLGIWGGWALDTAHAGGKLVSLM